MIRRPAGLLLVLALAAGALWATGVVSVHVNPPRTDSVSASLFWQEKNGEAPLPAALAVWTEIARVTRPAVVNVSTTQPRAGPRTAERRVLPAVLSPRRSSSSSASAAA